MVLVMQILLEGAVGHHAADATVVAPERVDLTKVIRRRWTVVEALVGWDPFEMYLQPDYLANRDEVVGSWSQ